MTPKISFWDAYALWKGNKKTVTGVSVTFGSLVMIAVTGIGEAIFSFFTEKILHWWWNKKRGGHQ